MLAKYYWTEFYNRIKRPGWPECINEHEFQSLPEDIRSAVLDTAEGKLHVGFTSEDIREHDWKHDFKFDSDPASHEDHYAGPVTLDRRFRVARDFHVLYNDSIDGHGSQPIQQHFPKMLRYLYPNRTFKRCLEWCAGPAFIGFRLLSDDLIQHLTVMDRHRPALTACEQTWQGRPARLDHCTFDICHGDVVKALGDQRFDLIVANPPNWDVYNFPWSGTRVRITQDPGWQAHTDFFTNIKSHLDDDGIILMCKATLGGQPRDHAKAISQGDLRINRVMTVDRLSRQHYWLEVTHA